ncbi:hypothetical protein D9M70_378810 [compost metagenome]
MTLLLDGEQVQGKELKVVACLPIESGDLSGQTSATDQAHQGFKPKTLSASMLIPFRDQAHLKALLRLAEATDGGGQRKVYRIVNDTANAFGIRQVRFAENVFAREDDSLAAWRVQFDLVEKLSNPERVEQRRRDGTLVQQQGPGRPIGADDDTPEAPEELSEFERLLKRVDGWLGPSA